jgi:hypothetical protein
MDDVKSKYDRDDGAECELNAGVCPIIGSAISTM